MEEEVDDDNDVAVKEGLPLSSMLLLLLPVLPTLEVDELLALGVAFVSCSFISADLCCINIILGSLARVIIFFLCCNACCDHLLYASNVGTSSCDHFILVLSTNVEKTERDFRTIDVVGGVVEVTEAVDVIAVVETGTPGTLETLETPVIVAAAAVETEDEDVVMDEPVIDNLVEASNVSTQNFTKLLSISNMVIALFEPLYLVRLLLVLLFLPYIDSGTFIVSTTFLAHALILVCLTSSSMDDGCNFIAM